MTKWKTCLLLCIMESRWTSSVLASIGWHTSDAVLAPDPEPGNAGHWEFLGNLTEMARYAVIAGYVRRLAPRGAVLDVGSSIGLLAEELKNEVSLYCGVERDPESVNKAKARNIRIADFVVADASSYTTTDLFDVVVFNETLYYLSDPIGVLRRYSQFLKPDGIIIISNFIARHLMRMPLEIAQNFHVIDQTTVINSHGRGWTIQAVRQPSMVGEPLGDPATVQASERTVACQTGAARSATATPG
jgi:SAM-dependent methyltransferase